MAAELQAIRARMRAAGRQIDAIDSLKHPTPADHRRLAELHEELAELTLAEGLAGADQEPAAELTNLVAIR